MFEKILEKVIDSYFGKYIGGIDKNIHLSVFKGSFKIENAYFKPEIMDLLDLPIEILFSNIGQIAMNIPWSKLSSSPVPISLDNIYLIVGPKKSCDWNFLDKSTIEKKLENINAYAKQCLDKLAQKNASEEKGTIEKMTIKIIDNIQLSFKNLHIRWEDSQKGYSFGLTLQELQANTTDENWRQTFIDRTKSEEANKPINKLLNLSNLRIYWNQNEETFLQNAQKYKIYSLMQSLIEQPRKTKNVEVIIEINADFKLINNQPQKFDNPLYELTIGLDWIDLNLKHQQLQQISDLINLSIEYRRQLWNERKKVVEISEEMKEFYKKHFMKIYFLKLKDKQKGEKEQLDQQQQQIFDSILKSIDYPTVNSWVRSVVKLLARENKLNEIINNKKGFFSSNVNVSIQADQIKEIEEAIEKQLEQTKKNIVQRPDESIHFCTSFILKGGSILLTKDNNQKQIIEGIKLTYSDLILYVNTTEDNGQEIFVKLQEISINLQNQEFGSKIPETINFLYRAINQNQIKKKTSSNFVQFIYKRHSIRQKNECKDNLDGSITCFLEPIECVYNHKFIERFKDFFDIKSQHEYFSEKKQKLEQISALQKQLILTKTPNSSQKSKENIEINQNKPTNIDCESKKSAQVAVSQMFRMGMDLRIESQTIIIPLNDINPKKPCWIFSLSRVDFKSSQEKRDIYELFNLEMKHLSVYYLQQRSLLHKLPILINEQNNSELLRIVENYSFSLNILQQQQNQFDVEKPLLQFEGVFDPLCLHFNEETLAEIMKIKTLISPSFQHEQEKLRIKKENLEKNTKFNYTVLFRQKKYQKQCDVQFIIDSTDRVYLFHQENNSQTLHLNSFMNLHLNNLIDYVEVNDQFSVRNESYNIQISKNQNMKLIDQQSEYTQKEEEIQQNKEVQYQTIENSEQKREFNEDKGESSEQIILDREQIKEEIEENQQEINRNKEWGRNLTEIHFNDKQFYIEFKSEEEYCIFKREIQRVKELVIQQLEQNQENNILNQNFDTDEEVLQREDEEINSTRNTSQSILPDQTEQQVDNISNVFNVSFKHLMVNITKNSTPYIDLIIENVTYFRLISSQNSTTNIKFQHLKIEDYIYKYNHSVFQPIFSASASQQNEQFFKVTIKEDLKSDEIDVQADILKCVMNWKPDSLLILRHLFVIMFISEESQRKKKQEELESKSFSTLITEILNDQQYKQFRDKFDDQDIISVSKQEELKNILVDYMQSLANGYCSYSMIHLKLNIQEVIFHFIQHETHAPLFKLMLSSTAITQRKTKEANFFSGYLGELFAFDLTNYPNTVNSDSQDYILEYSIIERKQFNKSNIVDFQWSQFEDLVTKEHYDSFMNIKISPISIIYQQQPVMRLIDYINNQILALISYSDEILQIPNSTNKMQSQPKNIFGQIDNIIKQCLCPKFMSLKVELSQPDIVLKALPNEEGFILAFESVNIRNLFLITTERLTQINLNNEVSQIQLQGIQLQLQYIWVQQYNIEAEYCQLKIQEGLLHRQLSLPAKMNLIWEQLLFYHEIIYLWPQLKKSIIRGNKLRGNMSSFLMRFNQNEYTEFLKMVFHNFTYDDDKDSEFIYNYKHVSALEPNPIDIIVDFQGLSLVKTEDLFLDPEIILSIQQSRVKWLKDSLQNIKLNLLAKDIIMSVFKRTEQGYTRKDIIGDTIGKIKKYSFLEDIHKNVGIGQNIIDDFASDPDIFIDSIKYDEKEARFNFRQSILKNSGDKDINFTVQDLKTLLQTDEFMRLMDWANPKQECYPEGGKVISLKKYTFLNKNFEPKNVCKVKIKIYGHTNQNFQLYDKNENPIFNSDYNKQNEQQ